jgi:hypothetical protein
MPTAHRNNPGGAPDLFPRPDAQNTGPTPPATVSLSDPPPLRKKWVEPVTAVLMALATVGTAWCSYQSAAWTRSSNRLMNECNSLERKAGVLRVQGLQSATIHVAMFMQLLAAKQAGNEKLANFYVQRLPIDARKAYDAWLAQRPFENPNADAHPFVPNLYELRDAREAADATSTAAKKLELARDAGSISGRYLANTVLFAAVLFFAGTAGKFEQTRVRVSAATFGLAVFAFAVIRMFLTPAA